MSQNTLTAQSQEEQWLWQLVELAGGTATLSTIPFLDPHTRIIEATLTEGGVVLRSHISAGAITRTGESEIGPVVGDAG